MKLSAFLQAEDERAHRTSCEPAAEDPDQEGNRHAHEAQHQDEGERVGRVVVELVDDHEHADGEKRCRTRREDRPEQPSQGGARRTPPANEESKAERDQSEADERRDAVHEPGETRSIADHDRALRACVASRRSGRAVEQQDEDGGDGQRRADEHGKCSFEPPLQDARRIREHERGERRPDERLQGVADSEDPLVRGEHESAEEGEVAHGRQVDARVVLGTAREGNKPADDECGRDEEHEREC